MGIEAVVATMGDLFGSFIAQLAAALQDGFVVEGQQPVHVLTPVVQCERLAVFGAQLGLFQKDDDQSVERVHLVGVQIVLGHDHIGLAHSAAFPCGQAHVGCVGVSPVSDDFGCGVLRDGVEQFVLHFGREELAVCSLAR